MRIIIRADGGVSIGMGHIMRTLVLTQHLNDFAEIMYACKDGYEFQAGRDYIRKSGFKVMEVDRDNIIEEILNIQGDCLITDSYDVNESYFDETKKGFAVTGYIDDLNSYRFNVDFIINQNSYAEDLCYKANTDTKLFLGSKYALLREEFINLPRKNIRKNIKDIMITMGGSDNNNFTKIVIDKISFAYPSVNLHVVIGPSFVYEQDFKVTDNDKIKFYKNPKMSNIMEKCDLAISACGSTLYELAASGIPAIGMAIANNQKRAAKKMEALGVILYSKNIKEVPKHIEKLDYNKRINMSKLGQDLVDGLGGIRLSKKIQAMLLDRID